MPDTPPSLIARHMADRVRASLQDTPAVLVNGPRQCGKTTLAKQVSSGMRYITLDDATTLEVARLDPVGLVRTLDRAVIDEVQRAPQLLLALKHSIDEDRRPGRFLLTSSSNLLSLPQIADSLAGRMEIHTLLPLSQSELQGRQNDFLQRAQTHDWPIANPQWATPAVHDRKDTVMNVLAGGFPEMRSRAGSTRQLAWANTYIKTLVERDVHDVAQIEHLNEIPKLLQVAASYCAQLFNASQIGAQLTLDRRTIERYQGVLEQLFLLQRLPAWGRKELGRLVKTPELHFLDAGLQAALMRLMRIPGTFEHSIHFDLNTQSGSF